MPYIPMKLRSDIDKTMKDAYAHAKDQWTIGELTYAIYRMCLARLDGYESYSDHAMIIGMLECTKQEFYRTQTTPYEERKRGQNGDIQRAVRGYTEERIAPASVGSEGPVRIGDGGVELGEETCSGTESTQDPVGRSGDLPPRSMCGGSRV